MQNNFTHFITAFNRSKNNWTLLAALLLFTLLAKSASAQTLNRPTPITAVRCVGETITYTASYIGIGNPTRATSHQWSFEKAGTTGYVNIPSPIRTGTGNDYISNLPLTNLTSNESGSYQVIFYRTTAQGTIIQLNTGSDTRVTLTVNPSPTSPSISSSSITSICSGGTATLIAENGPTNGSYKWYSTSTGGNAIFTGSTFNPTLTNTDAAASTVTYHVEAVNAIGQGSCVSASRTPVTVTIYALPTAGDDQAKCAAGPTTTFTLFGSTPFGSLSWSVESGNASIDNVNSATPTITVTGIGSAIIRLTSTGNTGNPCGTKTDDVVLTVNPNYTNALRQPDPITIFGQLEYFKPATFIAHPANNELTWTYEWTVNYSGGISVTKSDTDTRLDLTAEEMGLNFVDVQVRQVAPEGTPCVAEYSAVGRSPQQTPLPVELLYLKADKKDNKVVALEWATAMEQNSEGFEIQVSQDAQNYRTLAFVGSKAGGNTTQQQVYIFHDKENGKYGTRYYRLMQRDINGDSEYFGPKAVEISDVVEGLSAYPNVFTSEVNLEVNAEEAGTMHVLVTDATGSKVLERTVKVAKGNHRELLQFNSTLPRGLYFVTTHLNGKANHIKLLKK